MRKDLRPVDYKNFMLNPAMWHERNSVFLELFKKQHYQVGEVHHFADQHVSLLEKGWDYLLTATQDIRLEDSDAGYTQFYEDHLKPTLCKLKEAVKDWNLDETASSEAKERRKSHQVILTGYLDKLIEQYGDSPRDLAGEEIVRLYALRTQPGSDPEDVFVLLELMIESFEAYQNGTSCKQGIQERCRRDAGVLAESKEPQMIHISDYYQLFLDGFLPDGKPGRLLQQIVMYEILQEFGVEGQISELQLSLVDKDFLEDIWPRVQVRVDRCVKLLDLPWAVGYWQALEEVQDQLLESIKPVLQNEIFEGYAEVSEDIQRTFILQGLSRIAVYSDKSSIEKGAQLILSGESVYGDHLDILTDKAAKLMKTQPLVDDFILKAEIKELSKLQWAIAFRQLELDFSWGKDLLKSEFKWDRDDFLSLSLPGYGIRDRCFDDKTAQGFFQAAFRTLDQEDRVLCFSEQHLTEDTVSLLLARTELGDMPISSIASILRFYLEKDELSDELVDWFNAMVRASLLNQGMPEAFVTLYHDYPKLREKVIARYVERGVIPCQQFARAVALEDLDWIDDILRLEGTHVLFDDPTGLFQKHMRYGSPKVIELIIQRLIEARALSSVHRATGQNILHWTLYNSALSDESLLSLIEAMDPRDVARKDKDGHMALDKVVSYNAQCSDVVVKAYIQKIKTQGVIPQEMLLKWILGGIAPSHLLDELSDNKIYDGVEAPRENKPLFYEIFHEGKNPFWVSKASRAEKVDFYLKLLDRLPEEALSKSGTWIDMLSGRVGGLNLEPEIQLALVDKIDPAELKESQDEHVVYVLLNRYAKQVHPWVLEKLMSMFSGFVRKNVLSIMASIRRQDLDEDLECMLIQKSVEALNTQPQAFDYRLGLSLIWSVATHKGNQAVKAFLSSLMWDHRVWGLIGNWALDLEGNQGAMSELLNALLNQPEGLRDYMQTPKGMDSMSIFLRTVLRNGYDDVTKIEALDLTDANPEILRRTVSSLGVECNDMTVNGMPLVFYALVAGYPEPLNLLIEFALKQPDHTVVKQIVPGYGGLLDLYLDSGVIEDDFRLLDLLLDVLGYEVITTSREGFRSPLNAMLSQSASEDLILKLIDTCEEMSSEDIEMRDLIEGMRQGLSDEVLSTILDRVEDLPINQDIIALAIWNEYPKGLVRRLFEHSYRMKSSEGYQKEGLSSLLSGGLWSEESEEDEMPQRIKSCPSPTYVPEPVLTRCRSGQ